MQEKQFVEHVGYITARDIADEIEMTTYQFRMYPKQLRYVNLIEKIDARKESSGQLLLL
ncbi:TPA: FaeA/PapI family transcriptional regulator [Escherichia coli]